MWLFGVLFTDCLINYDKTFAIKAIWLICIRILRGSPPLLCQHFTLTYHTSIIELIIACFTSNLPARESEAPGLCSRLNQSDTPCPGWDWYLWLGSTQMVPIPTWGMTRSPAYSHIVWYLPDMSVTLMQLMCVVPLSLVQKVRLKITGTSVQRLREG